MPETRQLERFAPCRQTLSSITMYMNWSLPSRICSIHVALFLLSRGCDLALLIRNAAERVFKDASSCSIVCTA